MIASASAEDYRRSIELLAADPNLDAIVVIFIPPLVTQAPDVAEAMRAALACTKEAGKPLVAVWMAQDDAARAELAAGNGVPAYGTPEEAVRALAHAAGYARWRRAARRARAQAGRHRRRRGIRDRRRGAGRRRRVARA